MAATVATVDVTAATQKSKRKGESRILEALSDVRLKGSQQAVYFTLRGLGMPAIEGPGQVPRIEVFAAKQPQLFSALRRLGLRTDGSHIIVEAKDDELAPNRNAAASPGTSLGRKAPLQSDEVSGTLSMGRSRSTPALSAAEHAHFFDLIALPKGFGNKLSFMASLSEAAVELLRSQSQSEPASNPATVPAGACQSKRESKRGSSEEGDLHSITPWKKEGEAPPNKLSASASALPPVRFSRPRRHLHEQMEYCSKISKPLPRNTRSKVDNTFRYEREQSRTGLAAERHLLARLAQLHQVQQQKEEERIFAQNEELLRSLQPERGTHPPDPSKRPSIEEGWDDFAALEEQSRGTQEMSSHASSIREGTSTLGRAVKAV